MRKQLSKQRTMRTFIRTACAIGCKYQFTSNSLEVKNTRVFLPLVFFQGLIIMGREKSTSFSNDAIARSGPGPPHYRGFKINWDTSHSVGFIRTNNLQDAETSNWQHSQRITTSPVRSEPTIPVSEGSQTHVYDSAAIGIGKRKFTVWYLISHSLLYRWHFSAYASVTFR